MARNQTESHVQLRRVFFDKDSTHHLTYRLPIGRLLIGRFKEPPPGEQHALCIPCKFASAQHCHVEVREDGRIILQDHSSNGTFIKKGDKSETINKANCDLRIDDLIGIGCMAPESEYWNPEYFVFKLELVSQLEDIKTEIKEEVENDANDMSSEADLIIDEEPEPAVAEEQFFGIGMNSDNMVVSSPIAVEDIFENVTLTNGTVVNGQSTSSLSRSDGVPLTKIPSLTLGAIEYETIVITDDENEVEESSDEPDLSDMEVPIKQEEKPAEHSLSYFNQMSQDSQPIVVDDSPFECTQDLKTVLEGTQIQPTVPTVEIYDNLKAVELKLKEVNMGENERKELVKKFDELKAILESKENNDHKNEKRNHRSKSHEKDNKKHSSNSNKKSKSHPKDHKKTHTKHSSTNNLFKEPDVPVVVAAPEKTAIQKHTSAVPSTSISKCDKKDKEKQKTDKKPEKCKETTEKKRSLDDSKKKEKSTKSNSNTSSQSNQQQKQELKRKISQNTPNDKENSKKVQKTSSHIVKGTSSNVTSSHKVTIEKENSATNSETGRDKEPDKSGTKRKVTGTSEDEPKIKKTTKTVHLDPDIPIVDPECLPPSLDEVPIIEPPKFENILFKRPTHRQAHKPVPKASDATKPKTNDVLSKLRKDYKIAKPVKNDDQAIFKIPKIINNTVKNTPGDWIYSKPSTSKERLVNYVLPQQNPTPTTTAPINRPLERPTLSEPNNAPDTFLNPTEAINLTDVQAENSFPRRANKNEIVFYSKEPTTTNDCVPAPIMKDHRTRRPSIHEPNNNEPLLRPQSISTIATGDPRLSASTFNWKQVVAGILLWDPTWMYSKTPNPQVYDSVELERTKLIYENYNEYLRIMVPLIKLEIWENISQGTFKVGQTNIRKHYEAKVASVIPRSSWYPDLLTVTFRVMLKGKHELHLLRSKTMVIIFFENKCRRFGLIKTEWIDEKQVKLNEGILIDVLMADNVTVLASQGQKVQIEFLRYIGNEIHSFETLDFLPQESTLLPQILNPNRIDFQKMMTATTDYYGFEKLNEVQGNIVQLIAESVIQKSNNVFLVEGPPGTGKSRVIANLLIQMLHNPNIQQSPRILVCAPTNFAVDVIAKKLINLKNKRSDRPFRFIRYGVEEKMTETVRNYTPDELAENEKRRMIRKALQNVSQDAPLQMQRAELIQRRNRCANKKQEYQEITSELHNLELKMFDKFHKNYDLEKFVRDKKKEIIEKAEIVCTTLSSCAALQNTCAKQFNVLIIDEATQAPEIFALTPLRFKINTMIMFGDTRQLPATVKSQLAKKYAFGNSLFARIQKVVDTNQRSTFLLTRQYRMVPEILHFPNKQFYGGLISTSDNLKEPTKFKLKSYLIFELDSTENFTQNPHCYNTDETTFIIDLLNAVTGIASPEMHTICVLTPYATQKRLIEEKLTPYQKNYVTVSTIDAIQGHEKDIVIFSTVRTNGVGFMASDERLNVALTRARKALYICGNFVSLRKVDAWRNLIDDAKRRNLFCYAETLDRNELSQYILKRNQ